MPSTVSRMRAIVLIGAPGVGKSTTLTSLADALERDGVANAVVEVESLARAFPYPPFEQALAALPRVVELHRGAGHRLLLAAATPQNQGQLDALLEALSCPHATVIRLDVAPEVGVARITAREPEDWTGLAQLRDAARDLGARLETLRGVDRVIQTHASTPAEVMAQVRELAGI
jgi:adenylate kinase family enzyme